MKLVKGVLRSLPFTLLLCLPGCGKIVDWGKSNFNQGKQLNGYRAQVAPYIKSVTVYDQFATRGLIDALWLTDDVRTAYAGLNAKKFGKSDEHKKIFLRRQLEENNYFITFYVLSLYEMPLGDPQSVWSVFLRIGEFNYFPIEVKCVDLPLVYIEFFGKKYDRFKVAYSIKFDAKDIEDKSLITEDVEMISLYFRSVHKETKLSWNITSN